MGNGLLAQSAQELSIYNFKLKADTITAKQFIEILESEYGIAFLYEPKNIANSYFATRWLPDQAPTKDYFESLSYLSGLSFLEITPKLYTIKEENQYGWVHGSVHNGSNSALFGASVYVEAINKGVSTDSYGDFLLRLPVGTHQLMVSYIGYEPFRKEIVVEAGNSHQLDIALKNCTSLKTVTVVGSRFDVRPLLETPVPVRLIPEEEIGDMAFLNLGQALQYLAPSFHSTPQTISDGTDHIDPATLRGLGPDQVLVLVNGKRRHHSALVNVNNTIGRGSVGTDLNALPLSAIKRIEILRDGAAVQYGSDAIAGVINIVLKDSLSTNKVALATGITTAGDGQEFTLNGNHVLPLPKKGVLNLSFQYNQRRAINRSGDYNGPIFKDERDNAPEWRREFFVHANYGGNRVMSIGSAAINNTGFLLNAEQPLGEMLRLYAQGSFNYRKGEAAGFYRFPYQSRRQSGLYPLGFSPIIGTDILDGDILLGIRGEKAGWRFDLSNGIGKNAFAFNIRNSNNASMGLDSPTSAYAGGFGYWQNIFQLNLSKAISWLVPLRFSSGLEFRLEHFGQIEGDEWSWEHYGDTTATGELKDAGMQVFPGFTPDNATSQYRNSTGAYTTIEADISKRWMIEGGMRLERYSDFGFNNSWKIASRYLLLPEVSIRMSYNTGFRAPSMPQVHFSSKSFQFISVDGEMKGFEIAHINNNSSLNHLLDLGKLQAELSSNWSAGILFQEGPWSFQMDAYQIFIKDRIAMTGRMAVTDLPVLAPLAGQLDVQRLQFFTNAIDTKTRGLSISSETSFKVFKGRLRLTGAASYYQTLVEKVEINGALHGLEFQLFNREDINRLERAQPGHKLFLGGSYHNEKWSYMMQLAHFGEVVYLHPQDGNRTNWIMNEYAGVVESRDQIFQKKWLTNIALSRKTGKRFVVTLSGENVFDIKPDEHEHSANTNHGVFKYSRHVQQFGLAGAVWKAQITWRI